MSASLNSSNEPKENKLNIISSSTSFCIKYQELFDDPKNKNTMEKHIFSYVKKMNIELEPLFEIFQTIINEKNIDILEIKKSFSNLKIMIFDYLKMAKKIISDNYTKLGLIYVELIRDFLCLHFLKINYQKMRENGYKRFHCELISYIDKFAGVEIKNNDDDNYLDSFEKFFHRCDNLIEDLNENWVYWVLKTFALLFNLSYKIIKTISYIKFLKKITYF